ncbi:MAG: hypothetical protein IJ272_00625 [Clostridia bacterium]|nr:hypothetical protein [Clostridia bacterium]
MKIRKNVVAWMGIILCVLIAGIILATPANNLFALLPAALFIPLVITLAKTDRKVEEDEEETPKNEINWPLVIAWTLVALAAICAILVLIFFGWWFLLPLAIMFGLLIWVAYLLGWRRFWTALFMVLIVVAIILLGVYGIVGSTSGAGNNDHIDNLYVDNLYVEDATVGNMDVENETVANQTVENQDVENQTVTNQDVENSKVTNQTVENQDVENSTVTNQTVTNQVVENQTVTNQTVENQTTPTEPEETTPETTGPDATEPPATEEPKPTQPVHTHSYTSVVTEPTCMAQGYTTHTCSCGDSYKDSYKGALGHSYKSTVVAPTTEAGGYTEHKCERCGHAYKDAFTDKLPKPTEPEVVPAIKCASSIRYGETLYVNLEGINSSNIKVSNKAFVNVEVLSNSRIALTLTEDVTGYITVTDSASGTNVVIDIV